jgi:hypothetical protein
MKYARLGYLPQEFGVYPKVSVEELLDHFAIQQLREAFPEASPYRYVILDRDSKFDANVAAFLKSTGLKPKRTSVQAPWQRPPSRLAEQIRAESARCRAQADRERR